MKNRKPFKGFTLPELMIVIAIIAIITTLAVPAYTGYILKANRGEAQQLLMNWANLQEIWRSNHTTYADDVAAPNGIPVPTHDRYTFTLGAPNPPTAIAFVLTATATGGQADDKAKGTSCTVLTLNQIGTKTPADCWD